jgi:hypothetical protein
MRSILLGAASAAVFALLGACGGLVEEPPTSNAASSPTATSAPTGFYVPDDRLCARASGDTTTNDMRPQSSTEDLAVVELGFAEECTNLGGEYILARDLHADRKYWLGGHGCGATKLLFDAPKAYGVIRYMNTSSVLTIPAGVCVAFPGDDPGHSIWTPTKVRALARFENQDAAEAYAAEIRSRP